MTQFNYQGIDRAGKRVSGQIDVTSEGDLRMQLRSQGIRPTKIGRANALNSSLGKMVNKGTKLSLPLLLSFTRQLQVLINAGVPVLQGLEIIEEQATDKSARNMYHTIKEKVSAGSFLWEAISLYPKAFPKMYIALVRAGEASGSIDQMLGRLGRYLENVEKLRKMMKSAAIYPIAVITIAIGVIGIMLVFVIPKFEQILSANRQTLPAPTLFVMNLSHMVVNHIGTIVGTLVTVVFLGIRFAQTSEGKAIIDRVFFRVPIFGGVMQKGGTARFSRTLATLLASGVNILDAIDICRSTIDNAVLEEAVAKIRIEVEAGKTLGMVIGKLKVFPKMAVQMISVGEATGALDKMLEKVADFYEEEVEMAIGAMTKLIEPFMLVFLGTTVGGLMIAMYLPIFKMAGAAG